jgi:hypothetical protein
MKVRRFILALIILSITSSSVPIDAYTDREWSKSKEHYINKDISRLYKTEVFGFPFGSEDDPDNPDVGWMKSEDGWMTKKNNPNEKGEYKYLGYNYDNDPIRTDPVLLNYMLTTNFFDDDHPTAGKTNTGYSGIPEKRVHHRELQRHIGNQQ